MIRVRYWGRYMGWAWQHPEYDGVFGAFFATAEAACQAAWTVCPGDAILITPRV